MYFIGDLSQQILLIIIENIQIGNFNYRSKFTQSFKEKYKFFL